MNACIKIDIIVIVVNILKTMELVSKSQPRNVPSKDIKLKNNHIVYVKTNKDEILCRYQIIDPFIIMM